MKSTAVTYLSLVKRKRVIICLGLGAVAFTVYLFGIVRIHKYDAIPENTVLRVVDGDTGTDLSDVQVFCYAALKCSGSTLYGFGEIAWFDLSCDYLGERQSPVSIPEKNLFAISYSVLHAEKPPPKCHARVAFYKRGYRTVIWKPDAGLVVVMEKLRGRAKETRSYMLPAEKQVDLMIVPATRVSWDKPRGRLDNELIMYVRDLLNRGLHDPAEFKELLRFAAGEYRYLLRNDELDSLTRDRIEKKATGLAEIYSE